MAVAVRLLWTSPPASVRAFIPTLWAGGLLVVLAAGLLLYHRDRRHAALVGLVVISAGVWAAAYQVGLLPLGALAVVASGVALMAGERAGAAAALTAGFLSLAGLAAAVYRVQSPQLGEVTWVKPGTALLFLVWVTGFLGSLRWPALAIALAPDGWGRTMRRIILVAVAVPPVVGALVWTGVRLTLFDPVFALGLVVSSGSLVLMLAIVWTGSRLRAEYDVRERETSAAGRALQEAHDILADRLRQIEGDDSAAPLPINHDLRRVEPDIYTYRSRVKELASRLVEANAALESFSYSVSHDLRTPLRAIDGFARELETGYAPLLDDRGRHYLARVRSGAQRMSDLINDLLDLSRVSRRPMRAEPVDVSALASRVAAELRERFPSVRFDIAPDVVLDADPHMARLILDNLMGNAAKFSAPVDTPLVEVFADDGTVRIRDNGVGFDAANADKLFAPFQRLHGAEFEGSGVGLAIVQRAVHRHGGWVRAESVPGRGAEFSFTLLSGVRKEADHESNPSR